jgi:hypothetical protein
MSSQQPTAVINGIEKFGAKRVAQLLVQNDIRVIGVGEYIGGFGDLKNFEFKDGLNEIEERIDYWFDFSEDRKVWEMAEKDKSKLIIVGVNRSAAVGPVLSGLTVNWRIINVHGVYGEGMDSGETGEVDYLIETIRLAVANKNLIMPTRSAQLRLVAVDDFKEVVLRASFLSGTEKEVFEIWGRAITSEDVAKVLIEEGKMTRFKVEEEEVELGIPSDDKVAEDWKKLKWQPVVELGEGMKETIQYFFSRADEENRKKKGANPVQTPQRPPVVTPLEEGGPIEKVENKKRYEVMVEKEEPNPSRPAAASPFEEREKEKRKIVAEVVEEETEVVEEEGFEEIKPIIVKNSNMREVAEKIYPPAPPLMKGGEKKPLEEKMEKKRVDWKKYWKWGILGVGVAVLFWGAWWIWGNYQMFFSIKAMENLVSARKYPEAVLLINKNLALAKKEDAEIESWGINKWVWGRRFQTVLKVVEEGLTVGNKVVDLSKRAEEMNGAIFNDKMIDWKNELAGLKTDLNESSDYLGILQARLSGDWSWVPGKWMKELAVIKQQLSEVSIMVSLGNRAVDILPNILGTDGKRREFMVLLQNESELRAGGGFIGSWAILSFEGGKLTNFDIKDIYEADGQLKGHVEPPLPIKNYLGEANWYMRDANWQADFPAAAKDIQWFLDKETGRKVDGVVGVDLAVAKAILGATGEIYVPDFKEKINKDNIYEQAEFYSETNSFAGSTQKASFLGALGKQLFEGVKNLNADKRLQLVKAMLEMLQENEIQLVLNDKTAAGIAANLGWDGAIYDAKCSQSNCFADYLYVVESNFGVNKANYFLNRNINQVVDISPAAIGRIIKINYENTAKNSNWPGGDYKDYLRIYMPISANLAEVSITDSKGAKTIIQGSDLSINQVGGKKEIGFLATVPVGQKRTVTVSYSNQINLNKANSFSYLGYIQKQPGYGETPLVSLVSVPEGWQTTGVEPTATMVNGKLLFSTKLDRDIKMGVEIGK